MRLSIVTINYNNAAGLKKTIDSVIGQTFDDFEYLIIDGASTDKSVEHIKAAGHKINYWVSEADKGIYSAMNKGIERASGEYILMLNSGDCLADNEILKKVFKDNLTADIVYGNVIWTDGPVTFETSYPTTLSFKFFREQTLGHQAAFIRKIVHDKVGFYDTRYSIVADWKMFLLAICKFNVSYHYIPYSIAVCNRDGISCMPQNLNKIAEQREDVLETEFGLFNDDYLELDRLKNETGKLNRNLFVRLQKKISKLFS